VARQTPDGILKVHWVPTIASVTAPTVAELAAGTELTPFLAPAGLLTPDEGTEADASDLSSVRDKSIPSTVGGNVEGEFYRDDTTDTAWTTLTRDATGYILSAPFGGTGTDNALIATDACEVWTVRVSNRNPNRYTRGDSMRFTSTFTSTADPEFSATVTA